jgi:hypothetical protein
VAATHRYNDAGKNHLHQQLFTRGATRCCFGQHPACLTERNNVNGMSNACPWSCVHGQWNSHTLAISSTFFTVHGGGKKPHGIPMRTRKGVAGGYEQRAASVWRGWQLCAFVARCAIACEAFKNMFPHTLQAVINRSRSWRSHGSQLHTITMSLQCDPEPRQARLAVSPLPISSTCIPRALWTKATVPRFKP